MRTKKFLLILFSCIFATVALTGCGGDSEKKSDEGKDTLKIGLLTHLNVSEERYNEYMKKLEDSYSPGKAKLFSNHQYFDRLNEMVSALEADKIDMISIYYFVANYMIQNHENLEIVESEKKLSDAFCFAVREDDKELLKELDDALSVMLTDGTMKKLVEENIINFSKENEPKHVKITEIPDAKKIKVAVTGDLPPFDMILADGSPAGFSTAVMAEISRRIGKNIEFVTVDSGARAQVLESKKADVVF